MGMDAQRAGALETAPRILYLHGFASGPSSYKGMAMERRLGARGIAMERLDLRRPSLERLSFAAMMAEVERAIGGAKERVVLMGSSLGGLTAARVAERDARVGALVLLAPAFRFVERWRARLGDEDWRAWQAAGWLEVDDYAERRRARVHFGFAEETGDIDARSGGWPDVRAPTLILHGVRDELVDVGLSRAFAAGRRHVRLVELDDGHDLVASIDRIGDEAERFLAPWIG